MQTQPFKLSLKKNDQVQIIAGRDKGKTGKILGVNSATGRVTVEKLNMVKRHVKPTQKNPQGGILEKETGIHYSNVQLLCPKCNRGVRFGIKLVEKASTAKGKGAKAKASDVAGAKKQVKVRFCKRCDEQLDQA